MTYAVGNDGDISDGVFSAGTANATHNANIRVWSAQFPRVSSDVTGFAAAVLQQNRLGLMSITGSLVGVPIFDVATSSPGVKDRVANGSTTTLAVASGCTYAATLAYTNMSFNVDKVGDNVFTADFVNGVSDTLTETWDETP